jgi:hypothetical protein
LTLHVAIASDHLAQESECKEKGFTDRFATVDGRRYICRVAELIIGVPGPRGGIEEPLFIISLGRNESDDR